MSGWLAEKLHECNSDIAVATVGDFGESEHLAEKIVIIAGDGDTPFVNVGKVAFPFCLTFLSESFFRLAVFFLTAFLPLLQAVVARFQKHFIDLVGVDFDSDVAIGHGSRCAFQNQKAVLDFV